MRLDTNNIRCEIRRTSCTMPSSPSCTNRISTKTLCLRVATYDCRTASRQRERPQEVRWVSCSLHFAAIPSFPAAWYPLRSEGCALRLQVASLLQSFAPSRAPTSVRAPLSCPPLRPTGSELRSDLRAALSRRRSSAHPQRRVCESSWLPSTVAGMAFSVAAQCGCMVQMCSCVHWTGRERRAGTRCALPSRSSTTSAGIDDTENCCLSHSLPTVTQAESSTHPTRMQP